MHLTINMSEQIFIAICNNLEEFIENFTSSLYIIIFSLLIKIHISNLTFILIYKKATKIYVLNNEYILTNLTMSAHQMSISKYIDLGTTLSKKSEYN